MSVTTLDAFFSQQRKSNAEAEVNKTAIDSHKEKRSDTPVWL